MGSAFLQRVKGNSTFKLTVFLVALLAMTILPTLSNPISVRADINNTRVDAWGTLELSGGSWLNGNGVDIYSNGSQVSYKPNKPNNTVNGVTSGEEWQCVEMVNRLYLTNGWISSTWVGNGNTLVDNLPGSLSGLEQINGSISYLNPGDVITLDDGGSGHAAIVNSVGSTIQIVNQNTTEVYSSASVQSGSFATGNANLGMSGWAGYSVQAIVHHPGNTGNSDMLIPNPVAYQDSSGQYQVAFTTTGGINSYQKSPTGSWSSGVVATGTYSAPAAFADNIFVNTSGTSNTIYRWAYYTGAWHGPEQFTTGTGFKYSPGAYLDTSGTLHAVVVTNSSTMNHYVEYSNGTKGGEVVPIAPGTTFNGPPLVFGDSSGNMHIFVTTSAGAINHYVKYANGTWGSEQVAPDTILSALSGYIDGSGSLQLFGTTSGGFNHYTKPSGGSWSGEAITGGFSSAPTTFTDSSSSIHIFIRAKAGGTYHYIKYINGSWGSEAITPYTTFYDSPTSFVDSSGVLNLFDASDLANGKSYHYAKGTGSWGSEIVP